MPITQSVNSKANVKRQTTNDLPFSAQQPVINSFYATSTAGQTVINFGFSIQTTGVFANTDVFWLFIDGKKLDLGSTNDYQFTSVGSDGTSSQVTLNFPLPVNLNIQAFKLGLKPEIQFGMDNRFTQLYANQAAGFQGFVSQTDYVNTATTTAGTPAAGTFYSSIINRAPMVDLSQDMKPRFGIERIMFQAIQTLQNEFGPSGQTVYSTTNDQFGQIRFVGSWTSPSNIYGTGPGSAADNTSYIEITFYGTGLNLLLAASANVYNYVYSVDGGSESANFIPAFSTVISGRNYADNTVVSVVSGLSLGIHTVKIRENTITAANVVYGVEIINQVSAGSNLVSVNPGIVYNQGQKSALTAQSQVSYNSAVTGTTGGRVVEYITAAGTRGQAFTQNASSPSYLTSASHTNEEQIRTYHFREFGASRNPTGTQDDFSLFANAGTYNAAFTLDDGVTTLAANSIGLATGTPGVSINLASTSFLTLTFVGTGIDVWMYGQNGTAGTSPTFNILIDGTTINGGSASYSLNAAPTLVKIASGLPYGTHTVKFAKLTGGTVDLAINKFVIYQPKTPSIPSGAVQVGSYNVLANYVQSATVDGYTYQSQGVISKMNIREYVYVGTFSFQSGTVVPSLFSGWRVQGSSGGAGDNVSYTFFGTGIEFDTFQGGTGVGTFTVQMDGANYTGAMTLTGLTTGWSWNTGTSTLSSTTGGTIKASITGLSLGVHTIKYTHASGASNMEVPAFHVITPIHSPKSNLYADFQNTLTVGSNAISDDRALTPIKNALPATKAWAQAVGVTSSPTSTSTSFVPMPDMSCIIKVGADGKPTALRISYSAELYNGTGGAQIITQVYVDGFAVGTARLTNASSGTYDGLNADNVIVPVGPGYHKVDLYWATSTGTLTAYSVQRSLIVEEK